jgi:ATP-binding cassette subfamily B multidrug efflux pump
MKSALAQKTALIITHRVYGMLEFDKVIVLDQHKVVQEGTHEELMQAGGYYADMYDRQSKEQ